MNPVSTRTNPSTKQIHAIGTITRSRIHMFSRRNECSIETPQSAMPVTTVPRLTRRFFHQGSAYINPYCHTLE